MEDNQKKYLDRVISLLVRDTRIELHHGMSLIRTPFLSTLILLSRDPQFLEHVHHRNSYFSDFSSNISHTYGIGKNEMEYVWDEYRRNVKDNLIKLYYER